ncbi:MAG: TIR domain-containing protein [Chloroflexota bacterium]
MTIEEALQLLRSGKIAIFNDYRKRNPSWIPNFQNIDLTGIDLINGGVAADFSKADLRGAKLPNPFYLARYGRTVDVTNAIYDVNTSIKEETYDFEEEDNDDDEEFTFDLHEQGAIFMTNAEAQLYAARSSINVFISYAWANDDVVLAIDQWLRLKGINTKLDKRDFFAGSRIRDAIMNVMSNCEVILIFYSLQSKNKPWTQFERELASDLEIVAQRDEKQPPRIIYVVIDDTPLPTISEQNRIAIMAKGKRFELVCEEIYHSILEIPNVTDEIDLNKWSNYVF